MSFALDCIKPTGAKSDCDSTEGTTNHVHTRRSFSTGKISIPKSIYLSLKRDKPVVPSFVSENNAIKDSTLTRVARPNLQQERRKEISINLWIQEAKNVPVKKRYFCEIYLDGTLYARTTTKMMGDMLFWGEEFNLCNLDEVNVVALLLWRCADEGRSKKKKSQQQLICQINISSKEIDQRTSVEKWYSASTSYNPSSPDTPTSLANQGLMSTASTPFSQSVQITNLVNSSASINSGDQVPMLRVKARYQHLDVLPLRAYGDLVKFLNDNTVRTLAEIEPYLKVKAKEDLAQNLIKIIHKQGSAVPILCDLIMNEINKSDDKNLILRGNTMASKAMEIYLKLIGEKYLQLTLSDFINRVLLGQDDCEVDPQKDKFEYYGNSTPSGHSSPSLDKNVPQYSLQQRQESLLMNVDMIWAKIMSSSIYFPKDLRSVFVTLRQRLNGSRQCQSYGHLDEDQPDLCDRIISACIFLRYICPAILTPSLFGLIPEYPDNPKVTRTFTLVAKCIQTLANFSNLAGTKETYMVFMNHFIENNFKTMRDFLREISGNSDSESGRKDPRTDIPSIAQLASSTENREYLYWENLSSSLPEDTIDMALCLATLHRQMEDCLQMIAPQNLSNNLRSLQSILRDINIKLKSEEEIVPPIKISHSYQNIRSHPSNQSEYQKRISLETQEYAARSHSNDTPEHQSFPMNTKTKHPKPIFSRVTSNSHSAESTPTHQPSDKNLVQDYLMTQSMMENACSTSTRPCKVNPPSYQVDKEWKAMLSASYAYSNKSDDQFFAGPRPLNLEIRSSTSSGYQTLSRSTDSIEKAAEEMLILPKSPTTSLKPSVKKCKQARRQTDIIPRPDTFNTNQHAKLKIKDPSTARSVSTEEIRLLMTQNSMNLCCDDCLDCSSTQTLTSANVCKQDCPPVPEERFKLSNSISMPVVHSIFDIDGPRPPEFYTAFQGISDDGTKNDASYRPLNTDATFGLSNGRNSAFRDTTKSRTINQSVKSAPDHLVTMTDADQIKYSLNNLRQTLNSRMKQLLLADRTTLQLELERVRLMRRICDTSATNGVTTLVNNFILFSGREWQNIHIVHGNGPSPGCNAKSNKTISVKKYLDMAENVLSDAFNGQIRSERGRPNISEREMEDLLVQIFQTNQNLQNGLMSQSERSDPSQEAQSRQQVHIDGQANVNGRRTQTQHRSQVAASGKSSFLPTVVPHSKSSSLGSLVTYTSSSSSSMAGAALIEIVDAV